MTIKQNKHDEKLSELLNGKLKGRAQDRMFFFPLDGEKPENGCVREIARSSKCPTQTGENVEFICLNYQVGTPFLDNFSLTGTCDKVFTVVATHGKIQDATRYDTFVEVEHLGRMPDQINDIPKVRLEPGTVLTIVDKDGDTREFVEDSLRVIENRHLPAYLGLDFGADVV